jgi:ATP-dependent DNA helicase RecG
MTKNELYVLLEELVAHPLETQWLEFKMGVGSISNEQIGEYVSAMSNGATISNNAFGYLVWGVDDRTHEVKGTNFCFTTSKQGNQDLELWVRNLLHPKINIEIFEFVYHHKNVTLLRIPSAKGEPTHFKKKPFIRIGTNKTDLRNFPEYVRIIYNSLEDWSAKIIEAADIFDLDEDALIVARDKFKEKSSKEKYFKEIDEWDILTFLDKAKVTIDGQITNAAILLLGKGESSHFLLPSISEITWKLDAGEKAYEHFGCPLLLNTTKILLNIRNIKYKFFPDSELLATTVNKYDTRTILEALHNCIAHQDYSLNSRIIVTEKIDKLIFENAGSFFAGNPDDYTHGNKTPEKYRNPWLVRAMVNMGMIDTMGYGIHTMYQSQRQRFFPLPDYNISEPQKVILQILGHSIDENYTKLLIERKDLQLEYVVLLDKVQKKQSIKADAARLLKKEKLIEGRKPNYFVAASVAKETGQEVDYIKLRGIDDDYIQKVITDYLKKFKEGKRQNFESVLLKRLPEILSMAQKQTKIKNNLQYLRKKGVIEVSGKIWKMSKNR